MKVFEYSFKTGRGAQIADVKWSGCDCGIGKHGKALVHAGFEIVYYIKNNPCWSETLTASNFTQADAITFCTGYDDCEDVWRWVVVPQDDMIERAIARNQRNYGSDFIPYLTY